MATRNNLDKPPIQTEVNGLNLRHLTAEDTHCYFELVARNREHLTQHGDYSEVKEATLESIAGELTDPANLNLKFGIWLHRCLIGRIDLSPRAKGHYVIGYWLDSDHTGNGYATIACKALIRYGKDWLGATDIYAGVTKGNTASEAVLLRNGFSAISDRKTYTLFHLALSSSKTRA